MSGDTSETEWDSTDHTDSTERSLITDISDTFSYLSGESRAERKRQKLREALVREHIRSEQKTTSRLRSLISRFFGSG